MSFSLSTGNTVYASASATTSSSADTTATIKVTASAYITNGWVQSTGVVAIITINGSSSTKTVFGNGTKYTASEGTKSVSYSLSVSKTTATQSISWSVKFYQYTDGTQQSLKQTNSGTVSVAKKTSYAITYNANGGSGAPSAQTKWYGTALTLSTTKPTRTGYSFSKWNTASGGTGTSYASGASYTANAAATLYAQWTANTYTISFNANGGSGAPSSQTKTYGVTLTLSSTIPTRTNYNFLGWNTSSTAATAQYSAGDSFTTNAATRLYAVWELAYWKPVITNMKVARCASDGTLNDFGTYALVSFDWECCPLLGENPVSEITVECDGVTTSVSASGSSGHVPTDENEPLIVGADALSADNAYAVTVTVTDTIQSGSSSLSKTVSKAVFAIDFLSGGKGVAFGKPATEENLVDSNWKINVTHNDIAFMQTHSVSGNAAGVGVGSSGINCGVWVEKASGSNGRWLIYGDNDGYAKTTRMHLTATTDASGTADNDVPLIIGNRSGNHMIFDANEIIAKSSGTAATSLWLNEGGNTYIDNCLMAKNTVLWSGVYYMAASHTATLSRSVSAQANGIVLVWSDYENGTANDYHWIHHFIPKHHVSAHNGTGCLIVLANQTWTTKGSKYVYVYDTKIAGNANNNENGTNSDGITYDNKRWVLRYVIGV